MKLDAILWDYDGTLVNSARKNIAITKQILSVVAPRLTGDNLPPYLKDEKAYHIANHQSKNWQDLYLNFYGLTEKEMLEAGAMWAEYQLKNSTQVELFSEIAQTINQIYLPQGICSQNASENIKRVLQKNNLDPKFCSIIGYEDIPGNAQKPDPVGGILCLKNIFKSTHNKTIFFIGDHESDVAFARNIENALREEIKVISIAAKYSGAETQDWINKPDFEIETPFALLNLINNYQHQE